MSRSIATFLALCALSPLFLAEAAQARCFPERDGDMLVYFEQGDLAEPVVVGALWNDKDRPPASRDDVSVLAPHVLAAALLAEVASSSDLEGRNPGSIVRSILEDLSKEVARTYDTLEQVYESAFIATAGGRTYAESPKLVGLEVDGVFQATVDASIQQMDAYADLVAGVTKSVDEFEASAKKGEASREWLLLDAAAALIDFDLSLRDPDCQ